MLRSRPNANAFFEQDIGNCNDGHSWWPTQDEIPGWPGGPWDIVTATNFTAAEGGSMMIASDGNTAPMRRLTFSKWISQQANDRSNHRHLGLEVRFYE